MTKKQQLQKLNDAMLKCSKCTLNKNCSKVVFGEGNAEAKIMFVGEAPGKKEDEVGIPFVGSSGRILDKMLASIKMNRENVYVTNICKCRPPENRDPLPQEIQKCFGWLEKQIAIIDPKIIVTLGKFALNSFFPDEKISQVHGKIIETKNSKLGIINIFPLHHPAAARINKKTRAIFEEDFKKIPKLLQK